jgi:hypothetical protein
VPLSEIASSFLQVLLHFSVLVQQPLHPLRIDPMCALLRCYASGAPLPESAVKNRCFAPCLEALGHQWSKKTATQSQCRFRKDGTNFGTPLFR